MTNIQTRIESAVVDASPSLSRVGRWIAMHPIQALSYSAEEIASLTGTSVAAVNRFARSAGCNGFAHLKTLLGEALQSAVQPLNKLASASGKESSAPALDADAL